MPFIVVLEEEAGQRIDNFLIKKLKGVPKSRIYKAIRKGEVRVNGGRIKATYKLLLADTVRVPPVHQSQPKEYTPSDCLLALMEQSILYESDDLMVINKPAGLPVHGGTSISAGLIDAVRNIRPNQKFLELAHRLDRATSGCLVLAKKRQVLLALQKAWSTHNVQKYYLAIVFGVWEGKQRLLTDRLQKQASSRCQRKVIVSSDGQEATTRVACARRGKKVSLIRAKLLTGRTHQIRVHLEHAGFPIIGDPRYGSYKLNHQVQKLGINRMLLHAEHLELSVLGEHLSIKAPIPPEFSSIFACESDIQV